MNEPQPDAALLQLMEEMVAAKQAVQEVLKISPEDVPLHRIHGMYTGHILDIRKTILQEQAVDKDQLLIAALKGVVRFLLDHDEDAAAGFIGDHLEAIGQKVKEIWQDSRVFQQRQTVTPKSAPPSPKRSRPSAKPPSNKKSGGNSARAKTSGSSPKPTSRTT